ncbi:MAG: CPBP family intramembrane metalloprotease [Lachnospiraceae bacterium]|nr:CPBP family intramembrane metalloprotease [Lachnospiraceae bacterium]
MDKEERNLDVSKSMKRASVFFFLVMVFEIPMAMLVYKLQSIMPEEYGSLISILMTQGYLLVAAIIYLIVTKTSPMKDLRMKKYKISTFFLSLVVLVTSAPMATWLNALSQLFAKNETSAAIFQVTEMVPMWLGILIIGFLPGLVEETLYRGIMLTAFRKRSVLTGIVVSALSFGLMHMNFNQIMYAIYLGVVFALVVEATGSLISTMVLHMLFNGMNVAYVYILPKLFDYMAQYSEEYAGINMEEVMSAQPAKSQILAMLTVIAPFAVGGLVLTWLLLRVIAKINGQNLTWAALRGEKSEVKKTKPMNVFLIIGWIFCLALAISALFG